MYDAQRSSPVHPILEPFERAVRRDPGRPAASDPALTLDYQTLHRVAGGLARRIAAATERPHVAILAPTSVAGAVATLACWYAGRTPTPLNFLLSPTDLARIARDAQIDLALAVEPLAAAAAGLTERSIVLSAETLQSGDGQAPSVRHDDLAVLIYTSGTSGDPKGVRLTFGNIASNVTACVEHAQITSDETFLSVLPQFHSFGFTAMTVLPLMLGATVHFLPRFSPAAVVGMLERTRATVFMAVASMYAAMLKLKSAEARPFESVRLAISGGEPLSPAVAAAFDQRFGVQLNEGYGLTETSPVASINVPWRRRAGSVGTALPGVEIAAVGPGGEALPRGTEGELVIRGHCVMQGYHNKPEQTREVLRDGALRTGDMGRVDADGFVYVTGRVKEMIIVGGENVFPREIEEVLTTHPAVAEAAVIGVRDDLRGEVPIAFIIPHEGAVADAGELRGYCRERLPGYKVPREVRVATTLPRGPTGKILKRQIKP